MATYKCEVKQRYGKYSGWVWKATERQGNPVCAEEATSAVAVTKVVDSLRDGDFGSGDEVIFRDIAYTALSDLRAAMARAPY
jgi:hypothetical protein